MSVSQISCPDITLLPLLARVLKIDVNTLLAFNEELTDDEINKIGKEIGEIASKEGYEKAFEKAGDLIKQYPSCDELIYRISLVLRIYLLQPEIQEKDKYERKIIEWLELVASGSKEKIAYMAKLDLSAVYRDKKEYEKAQEILDKIQDVEVDKKFQQALLFENSGNFHKAYCVFENILIKNVHEIMSVLSFIIMMLCKENKFDEAEEYLKIAKKHIETFDLGTYHEYTLDLFLQKEKKNKEKVIEIIINMVNEAGSMDNSLKSKLYKYRNSNVENKHSEDWYKRIVIESIKKDKTLDFIKSDSKIKFLLECN